MLNQNFIFSEKRSDRIKRHLLFWFVLTAYLALLQSANPSLKPTSSYISNLPAVFTRSFVMQIPQAFAAYSILYLIVPLYFKKRQLLPVVLSLFVMWVVCALINVQITKNLLPALSVWILPDNLYRYTDAPPKTSLIIALLSVTKGMLFGAGFLLMLRYVKQWYMKEQRNLQLQKENTESRLKLLTAQVHPHFLFNTLNNIFSQTQTESPKGSKMIMELSDMLRYILAEGGKTLVPLQKELAMIQDYINLERIRYGNKLDVHLSMPTDTGYLQIAPLLLLPFVENCFKHGASRFLVAPWINLKIEINGRRLTMKLMNGKESGQQDSQTRSGTGINNVQQRLQLLYPGKHELKIIDQTEVFVVNLSLELTEEKQVVSSITEIVTPVVNVGYA